MSAIPLIVDTDIGDDIDDALALAFALRCPELDVIGVTTVYGYTQARAKIASSLLKAAGRPDIPVYAGCGKPIQEPKDTELVPCQYVAEDMDELAVSHVHAVDYLIERAMNADRRITVLAIGPLTNVAMALIKEPRLKERVEKIVLMGGAYYFHFVEWNIRCDPEAAHVVFESGIPLTAVGLDATKRCLMNEDQLARLTGDSSPAGEWLHRAIRLWQKETGRTCPILHDALAVYGVFGSEFMRFEREAVSIELSGISTRGMTFNWTDRDREEQLASAARSAAELSSVLAAKEADGASFVRFFLERMLFAAAAEPERISGREGRR